MTEQTMRAHCPRCDGDRVCLVHGSFDQPWEFEHEYGGVNGQMDHRLLQCRGCETAFYWKSSWDSEGFDHRYNRATGEEEMVLHKTIETFPAPEKKSKRPDWAWSLHKHDRTLQAIMSEVYEAAEGRSYILASIGLRTALDRLTEMLGIGNSLSFEKKVQALLDGGWVGETEKMTLDVVADAGSANALSVVRTFGATRGVD